VVRGKGLIAKVAGLPLIRVEERALAAGRGGTSMQVASRGFARSVAKFSWKNNRVSDIGWLSMDIQQPLPPRLSLFPLLLRFLKS